MPQPKPTRPPIVPNQPNTPEIVDPRWIISALAGTLAFGVLCAWITVCVLFYQGQWQLVLQPSRTIVKTPASLNLPFTEVHFAPDASGQLQLSGWWIPADNPSSPVALVTHDALGNMSDALADAALLHNAQLNVFLFDYRGYGQSTGKHPTQALMQADTDSAFRYLTDIRGIPPSRIVVYGDRLGASLAVNLCTHHPDIAALILQQPQGDTESSITNDTRSRLVPIHLLFNQTFPVAAPLHTLATPKLLITLPNSTFPTNTHQAADPKITIELNTPNDNDLHNAIGRFLDSYLNTPPATLNFGH